MRIKARGHNSDSLKTFDPTVFIHYLLCSSNGKLSAVPQNGEICNTLMPLVIPDRRLSLVKKWKTASLTWEGSFEKCLPLQVHI